MSPRARVVGKRCKRLACDVGEDVVRCRRWQRRKEEEFGSLVRPLEEQQPSGT